MYQSLKILANLCRDNNLNIKIGYIAKERVWSIHCNSITKVGEGMFSGEGADLEKLVFKMINFIKRKGKNGLSKTEIANSRTPNKNTHKKIEKSS